MMRGHPCLYDALYLATTVYSVPTPPTSYLEIGVSDGASLSIVLGSAPIERIVLCDTWGNEHGGSARGSNDHIVKLLYDSGYVGKARILDGSSHDLIKTLPHDVTFDLINVDGDHSPGGAAQDLCDVWPLLRPGGLLCFDDTDRLELSDVYNTFITRTGAVPLIRIFDTSNGTSLCRRPL
jgi:predicted O-methyltransferase YrrM